MVTAFKSLVWNQAGFSDGSPTEGTASAREVGLAEVPSAAWHGNGSFLPRGTWKWQGLLAGVGRHITIGLTEDVCVCV